MEMKKVVLIAETMEGGVRRHVMDLINGLDTKQFAVTLIYGNRIDNPFILGMEELKTKAELINVRALTREINPRKDLKALKEIKQIIKAIDPDIVHCHSSKAGAIGRLAAKSLNVKKVFYTPHAYSFVDKNFSQTKKHLFITLERLFSKKMTTYTFNVSQNEKNQALLNKLDEDNKFKVIYNGIPEVQISDKCSLRQELMLTEDTFVVGNNGRLSSQKNPLLFLQIAKEIITLNPLIHFVWAGDGPDYEDCLKFIESNQLEDNIHLLGFRDDAEFIVSDYDIFLMTSGHEGLPYSLIEAMRASVPIVGFVDSGLEEIINKENGILVSNSNEATDKILNYWENMTFSKDSIYSYFQQFFSIEKMLEDIKTVYVS